VAGVYTCVFTSATAYNVYDPQGRLLGTGANGTAFADEIKFLTTAGGAAFVAGDTFNLLAFLSGAPALGSQESTYFRGPADASGITELGFRL
jgi:hypothetical protein